MLVALFYIFIGMSLFGAGIRAKPYPVARAASFVLGVICFLYGIMSLSVWLWPPPVTLYSLKGCPHCTNARSELSRNGLRYREVMYHRGMDNPPPLPDGTKAKAFPQIYTKDGNMGSYKEVSQWAYRYK